MNTVADARRERRLVVAGRYPLHGHRAVIVTCALAAHASAQCGTGAGGGGLCFVCHAHDLTHTAPPYPNQ